MPHQRDLQDKKAPTYEVNLSHHYQQSEHHQMDMKQMVGPVYGGEAPHSFSDNYGPIESETTQQERIEKQKALVSKFFEKDKAKSAPREMKPAPRVAKKQGWVKSKEELEAEEMATGSVSTYQVINKEAYLKGMLN